MARFLTAVSVAVVLTAGAVAADPPKDTKAAEHTRVKKLKGKVTVEAKNIPLKEILSDISDQLVELKLGPISTEYETGISGNTRTSLNVKGVTAEEALDKLFGSLDLGYVVVSKSGNAHDGYLRIVKGTARGYESGAEPKTAAKPDEKKPEEKKADEKKPDPKPPAAANGEDEKAAESKLDSAKKLIADGKVEDAKPVLKYVVRFHPTTKAAAEAKKVLDEHK